ncbi:hypothetical protein SBV1_440001 [Verrucomicrobia bacterium]|nr:hypothetical protein SBV1_440001 [Verrucomicrobiota bacterium]
MNRDERTDPSPRPSPLPKGRGRSVASARCSLVGSWEARFRFRACVGTMNGVERIRALTLTLSPSEGARRSQGWAIKNGQRPALQSGPFALIVRG